MSSTAHIPITQTNAYLKAVPWVNWHGIFRLKTLTWTSIPTRRVRWPWWFGLFLAGIVILVLFSVSLAQSILALHVAEREWDALFECIQSITEVEFQFTGNDDMYGIGVRISTYLQIVMTIIAEFCADPKFATALTSVNLWFLWALNFAMLLAKDNWPWEVWRADVDVLLLRALGGTIGFANLGAVILPPTKQMEHISAFTRFMQWVTLIVWLVIDPIQPYIWGRWTNVNDMVIASESRVCRYTYPKYQWAFFVFEFSDPQRKYRLILSWASAGSLLLLGSGSLILYWRLYPGSIIRTALKRSKDSLARAEKMPRLLFDLCFIYPAADVMVLMDVESPGSYKASWCTYIMDRYSLRADTIRATSASITSPVNSASVQPQTNACLVNYLWAPLTGIRRVRNRINGPQARVIWNTVVLLFSILRVEFTIAANQIKGVNNLDTTGQLIPFVISVGAMLAMITDGITRERKKIYGFPLLAGEISADSQASDENV